MNERVHGRNRQEQKLQDHLLLLCIVLFRSTDSGAMVMYFTMPVLDRTPHSDGTLSIAAVPTPSRCNARTLSPPSPLWAGIVL